MATIVVPGFNNLFHVSHLSLTQWLAVIVGSFLIVVLVELVKAIQRALGKDKNAIYDIKSEIMVSGSFLSHLEFRRSLVYN